VYEVEYAPNVERQIDELPSSARQAVLFAVEVGVDGAVGVARLLRDRRDRGALEPLAGEDPLGGVQQLGPGQLLLFAAAKPARAFRLGHSGNPIIQVAS